MHENILIYVIHKKTISSSERKLLPSPGQNEHWNECGSACGDDVCGAEPNSFCTQQCVARCECDEGHKRNAAGFCVKCADDCGEHESWAECKSCTEESCEEPMMCVDCLPDEQCCAVENKCMCDAGYVRSAYGACVKKDQCGKSCPVRVFF